MRANEHIRTAAKEKGVPMWKIASAIGVCDMTLYRWMRFPLPLEKENKIMGAIQTLAKEV